ncbi:MAG: hypothetical protein H6713_09735 [Myxococcales bacterium]|nr:hypothetical protein [Myxococcales bacterium]
MGTTMSMILGLAFVVLGITAVMLQSWLWGFPMDGDKSTAPRLWTNIHRVVGLSFVVIYVIMMYFMFPRLWTYQVELPARTVVHAVAAIMIGVLLLTKLAIIRLFPHFGGSLPKLGFGLLSCTVILGALSLPYAMQAHGLGGVNLTPEKLERVRAIVAELPFEEGTDVAALTSTAGLEQGQTVLTHKCTVCHDMRTILAKPRTGASWYKVVVRMAEKPIIMGEPMRAEDIGPVTAYLVAITPNLQQSFKRKVQEQKAKAKRAEKVAKVDAAEVEAVDGYNAAAAEKLTRELCTQCHEMDEVEGHGGDDEAGWAEVVRRMVEDEEAEVGVDEAPIVVRFLAEKYPKAAGSPTADDEAADDKPSDEASEDAASKDEASEDEESEDEADDVAE